MPRALITGVTGQDGRYLAEFLLDKGYEVFGTIHRSPQGSTRNGMEIPRLRLLEADLLDKSSLVAAIELSQPDEVYNLGGISYVPLSFLRPELTADVTGMGLVRLLDAIRLVGGTESNPIRLYQASSSEMFGRAQPVPYSEETPLRPISPYAAAKTFAHNMTLAYRNESNLFAASGILFNHESPRRPIEFVSRKVTNAVARISLGLQSELSLGNLEAQRDWGFAGDFVGAMWLMLQQDEPQDFVIATGKLHSVRDLVATAFRVVDIEDWERFVKVDPRFVRPPEANAPLGDASKAEQVLGWKANTRFEDMIRIMIEHDLEVESTKLDTEK